MSFWNNIRKEPSEEQRIHNLLASDDFELI
jgi:hypothetical protein